MRFYCGSAFDSQGRLNISSYSDLAGRTVMLYTTEEDFDLIYAVPYYDQPNVPKRACRKVDYKGRITIPASLRRDADYAYISNDTQSGIAIKLVWRKRNKSEDEPG